MISRRENYLLPLALFAAVAGLTGCDGGAPQLSPIDQARADIAAGRLGDAEVALNRMVAEGTPRGEVASLLGESALARGDLIAAASWLAGGEFSPSTQAHGFHMQGRLAMAEGNLAGAGQAFDRSLQIKPDNAELWVDIGRLRYRGGEQIQALDAAKRAVEFDPTSAAALQFRGQLARDSEGLESGIAWFSRALEGRPDDLDLRVDLAATLGDAGHAQDALAVLRANGGKAVRTPRGLFVQSVLAARGGNLKLARDLLERSGLAQQDVPAAAQLAAIIDIEQGNFASAAQTLDRLAQRQPDNGRVADLLALALSRSGAEKELILRFADKAQGPTGSVYLRTLVGRALEAIEQRGQAAQLLDRALDGSERISVLPAGRSSGNGAAAVRDAIRSAIAGKKAPAAVTKAKDLARRFPGSGDALALLGDAQLAAGNKREAVAAYSRSAIVRRPWPLASRLVSSLRGKGAAISFLEDFVRSNPSNGEAAALLADAYAAQGEWQRSAMLLDHALAQGQSRVPWVLAARSVAARQLQEADDALAFALEAYTLQPMNPHAIAALIAALPEGDDAVRHDLTAKIRSLAQR